MRDNFLQWTYQAIIHELIGLKNNTVDLTGCPEVSEDLRQLTLSSTSDAFFRQNMYANFGEIGQTVKTLVNQYQEKAKSHQVPYLLLRNKGF
jgi:vacuolar protein sorting-associated protein 45